MKNGVFAIVTIEGVTVGTEELDGIGRRSVLAKVMVIFIDLAYPQSAPFTSTPSSFIDLIPNLGNNYRSPWLDVQ